MEEAEALMLQQPQASCPVTHHFGPGVYMREVRIPAGTLAIGHHQNFEHMNVMLKGRVTVLDDNGMATELVAPLTYVGKPGRKIGFIHEDVVWLNIYSTTETDVEKLEATLITKSQSWIEAIKHQASAKMLMFKVDADDFDALLLEVGMTREQARQQAENKDDMTELPMGSYKIRVAPSPIEGFGLFATADIAEGERIAPARIQGKRTIAGRYTNHSASPNARMVRGADCEIDLVAIKPIPGSAGGFDGEEITVNYRESIALTLELSQEN